MAHGRRPLSAARKMVVEFLHHAKQVPSLSTRRRINVAALARARRESPVPISWLPLFLRTYGLTAQRHPELRTAYIPYPRPHLYEHDHTECLVPIEREVDGELVVLGAKLRGPETMSLTLIQSHLRRFKEAPVESISPFRQTLRMGRAPWLWRRFVFWSTLYWSGKVRADRFGTCVASSLGHLGAEQLHPLTALTTYFSAGPVDATGNVDLKIIYDHRVMDDSQVARCLISAEEILNSAVLTELREIHSVGTPEIHGHLTGSY